MLDRHWGWSFDVKKLSADGDSRGIVEAGRIGKPDSFHSPPIGDPRKTRQHGARRSVGSSGRPRRGHSRQNFAARGNKLTRSSVYMLARNEGELAMDIGIDLKEHKKKTRRLDREDANSPNLKRINLALQGGGSHGAFAWGVLDRLLEDGRIEFDGISATSVGAMNAAVLASGLAVGGRAGARNALADRDLRGPSQLRRIFRPCNEYGLRVAVF